MARTFLGRVAKDSIAPANKQFAEFVEESNSNPISLARNEQERLNYNVAQNLQQADQGLISPDRASVMAKSYFDAKQAPDMQTADLTDAYNRNRLEGSLQEEATLKRAGINPNSTSTVKRIDAKTGDEYTTTTTRGAKQTNRADEGLDGTPTAYYGIGETTGPELMTKKKVQAKKSGSGDPIKNAIQWDVVGNYDTHSDLRDKTLKSSLLMNATLAGDSMKLDSVMTIAKKVASGEVEFGDGMAAISQMAPDFDPKLLDMSVGALAELQGSYEPSSVIKSDGTTTSLNLRPMKTKVSMRYKDSSTGGEWNEILVDGYIDEDDKVYGEFRGDDGKYYKVPRRDFDKYQERVRKNYKRTKGGSNAYHLSMGANGNTLVDTTPIEPVKSFTGNKGKPTPELQSQQKARLDAGDTDFKEAYDKDLAFTKSRVDYKLERLDKEDSDVAIKYKKENPKLDDVAIANKWTYDEFKNNKDFKAYMDDDGNVNILGKQIPYLQSKRNPLGKAEKQDIMTFGNSNNDELAPTIILESGDTIPTKGTMFEVEKDGLSTFSVNYNIPGLAPGTFALPENTNRKNLTSAIADGTKRLFEDNGEQNVQVKLNRNTSKVK